MTKLTYDHLTAIMQQVLDAGELSPCETSAPVEAFEGGDGEGPAIPGAAGEVDSDAASRALEKFMDDLSRVAQAIRTA